MYKTGSQTQTFNAGGHAMMTGLVCMPGNNVQNLTQSVRIKAILQEIQKIYCIRPCFYQKFLGQLLKKTPPCQSWHDNVGTTDHNISIRLQTLTCFLPFAGLLFFLLFHPGQQINLMYKCQRASVRWRTCFIVLLSMQGCAQWDLNLDKLNKLHQ